MAFERNDGTSEDDVQQNTFISYITKAFYRNQVRYTAQQEKYQAETMFDPDELDVLLLQQMLERGESAAERAGFSPMTWGEIMDSIENPKLDRILCQLTSEEQELLFYRLFHRLSYKDIALRNQKCAREVQIRYDTIIRKLRRWWGKEK